MRVALPNLENIGAYANTSKCAGLYLASSATRQFVSRQGGCLARKLRVHGLVAMDLFNTNPRSGEPIPTRPVTANSVNDSGTTQYPDRKAEEGHGDKGGRDTGPTQLSQSARVIV